MTSKNERRFYVYGYLRKNEDSYYYIGKGTANRAYRRRGRTIPPPTERSRIVIIQDKLTEEEAFAMEREYIAKYGRISNGTGILYNLTDGGEGVSGKIYSETELKRLSELMKAYWEDPDFRERQAEISKAMWRNPDFRERQVENAKALWEDPERRERQSESMKALWSDPVRKAEMLAKRRETIARKKKLKEQENDKSTS